MIEIIMNKSIKLVLKEGTIFDLYFIDGIVKRYDILSLVNKFPQLNALKDRELFLKGKLLGWSGVYWNDDLDIECDTVYEEGVNVSKEYDDIDNVVLGYKIRELRRNADLSQVELASKAGIDQSDLSKIEKGLANPSIKQINKVLSVLGQKLTLESIN